MKRPSATLLALVAIAVLAALPKSGLAWGKTGHDAIAQIAYDNLTPHAKAAVDKILKNDPGHRDLDAAASWPDDIRRDPAIPQAQKHPKRHYVDVPIVDAALPPEAARQKLYADPESATYGIRYYAAQLHRINLSAQEQADDLSWLIHLVGDVHQPLHCVTLINSLYPLPDGDKGGNLEHITGPWYHKSNGKVREHKESLHQFWDEAPELLVPGDDPKALANQLEAAHPAGSYNDSKTATAADANAWADESAALGLTADSVQDGDKLTDDYVVEAQSTVSDRLAHAGYRLASVLNKIFK